LPDPDLDRHPGYADPVPANPDRYGINSKHIKKFDFFPENFNMWSKILKTYDTFETDEKDKHYEVTML
jgi:hypothetical protein